MNIEITSRHTKLPESMKKHAEEKLQAMLQEYPRVETAHIIFDMEKFRNIAEIVVQGKNRLRIEAKDISDDMQHALDGALAKLDRQLRRSRDKIVDHKISKNRTTLTDVEKQEE